MRANEPSLPSLPGRALLGACGQRANGLLPACPDHTVGIEPSGEGTPFLSGPPFPHLYKEEVGSGQTCQWRQTWLSPTQAPGWQLGPHKGAVVAVGVGQ